MLTSTTTSISDSVNGLLDPNSKAEILKRTSSGLITWAGPLGMLVARSILCMIAQALVILIFWVRGSPDPLRASTVWWQVTGTLVDLGCLALLLHLTRKEGIRLFDLIGFRRDQVGRDLLIGLGILVVMFPVVMIGGSMLSGLVVYGTIQPDLPVELLSKSLPLWAAIYARGIWWLIWSVTEEMTYNGYALPRLQTLFGGRTWAAVGIVSLAWSVQHSFLPFIFDLRVFFFLFVQMLPLTAVMQLLYLRFRRLPRLVVMHWGMDLFSAIMMIKVG